MRTVEDYASGKILEDAKKTELKIQALINTGDPEIRKELEERSKDSKNGHFIANTKTLKELIEKSKTVATGPRICLEIHKECEQQAESVFLDELAEALINVGKVQRATKEEAYNVLKEGKKRGHPHLVSIVANKPLELCNSCTDCCVLWKSERLGILCISK